MTPDFVRSEVERGAKFVVYNYCVSLVVITLKRSSDIYFIRPVQNRIVPGIPFTLLSLVAGWWGFPWGPIYTIESLVRNLGGGTDVTSAVMETLCPTPVKTAAPALSGAVATAAEPAPAKAAEPRFTPQQAFRGVALLAVLAVLLYSGVCYVIGQNMDVALVSGLSKSYTVNLNGKPQAVPAHGVAKIKLAAGAVALSGAPGFADQTLQLDWQFWSRPFSSRVAVINPDGAGIFYERGVVYYPRGSEQKQTNPDEKYVVHANELSSVLPKPEFFFEEAAASIKMSSRSGSATRQQFDIVRFATPYEGAQIVAQQLGAAAAERYVKHSAQVLPNDEFALAALMQFLKPEDAVAFLETRLSERPVLVEWHRFYQNAMEAKGARRVLEARYGAMVSSERDNGPLLYLQGRVTEDRQAAADLFQRALAAPQPCLHGYLGLVHIRMSSGDFAGALALCEKAEASGLSSASLKEGKREALLALGRYDVLLQALRQQRQLQPSNLDLAVSEIELALAANPRSDRALAAATALADRLTKASFDPSREQTRAFLDATIAYATGDEKTYARMLRSMKAGPAVEFRAAISARDCRAAEAALTAQKEAGAFGKLLLYLAASEAGDDEQANGYWQEALAAMKSEPAYYEELTRLLGRDTPPTAGQLCDLGIPTELKRIVLVALGRHDPAYRASCYEFAARLNNNPKFPHLLLQSVMSGSKLASIPPATGNAPF